MQRAVLGAALIDNSLLRGPLASLSVADFVGTRDRDLFRAMLELSEGGEPLDELTLSRLVENCGGIEGGGAAYVGALIDGAMPDSAVAKRHAEELIRLSYRKNSVVLCGKIPCGMHTTFTQIRAIRVDGTTGKVEGLTAERARRSIIRVLDETPLGAWATITSGGEAHVNTAYYSYSEDLVLYFMSHPHSLHCHNVSSNSSTAVAIFASEQTWTDPGRGLQLFGRCDQLKGGDAEIAEKAYEQRFRAYADWKGSLKPGDAALDYQFYRFVPHRVKILDEAEFGDAVWVEVQVECRS